MEQAKKKKKRGISIPSYTLGEEIFNAISHGIGGLLSIIASVMMLLKAPALAGIITVTVFISAVTVGSSVYAYQHRNG